MATRLDGETLRWLDALGREGSFAELSDGQLLERFLAQPGASSEAAFEVLVRRHGPLVLSLCRRVLRDDHAAADAFQATFLVLARRASTIRDRDLLAPWLGRVARRIARRSRKEVARRAARERRSIAEDVSVAPAAVDGIALEAAALVRAEVDRLPEADRLLLRLTYWQGKTYEEAAAALSWPIGTVRSRLSRIRERLRGRLARLGLSPALAAAGSAVPAGEASAAPPPEALIVRTVRAAARSASAGGMTAAIEAGLVPATVAALVNGELSMTAMIPWRSIAVLFLLGGTMTAGVGALSLRGSDPMPAAPARPAVASEPAAPSAPIVPQAQAESKAKSDSKSILTNGGVEDGEGDEPKGWTTGAMVPGVEYLWSRTGHEGKASLCLKKTARRYFPIAQWSQTVKHEGGGPRLKVSAWVKADRVTKAILDAQFLDGDGQWSHAWAAYIGPKDPNGKPFTHGWKKYEGVVAIPPGTKQILIAPQIYGPGTVWFDDLAAEYTDAPAIDPTGS
jgi:RNA polymerase sigma-70 factor (ECF subfamily)